MKDNVHQLEDTQPYWTIFILCLPCLHRWIGAVTKGTALTSLECPRCGKSNSFASFLPADYIDEHCKGDGAAVVLQLFGKKEK